MYNGNYKKLYANYNKLQSENSFTIKEIEQIRNQLADVEDERIELSETVTELSQENG